MNPDQNMNQTEIIQLTQEEKEETVTKSLNANNPQAPSNLTEYSHKNRAFKTTTDVDQLVTHLAIDGDIILKSSEEATDQEEYHHQKDKEQKDMLLKVNEGIKDEKYKDYRLEGPDQKRDKMISLRNTFNYQDRGCQTFNLPIRERGIKTDPPQLSLIHI